METLAIAWVVTYVLHSTILVLGAWLLEQRWRDRPERMSAVWKTALVGGVLTASLQTGLGITPAAGQWALSPEVVPSGAELTAGADALPGPVVSPAISPAASPESPAVVAASWPPPDWFAADEAAPVVATVVRPEPLPPAVPEVRESVALASTTVEPTPVEPAVTPEPVVASEPWIGFTARRWIVGLLGAGALLGLLSVIFAFLGLRRQLRGRRVLREGSMPGLLEGLRRRAQTDRRVSLTVAPRVRVPMAVGVLHPEIVVPPEAAAQLSESHQQSLLAHELAHVLRRDPTWRLIALCMERIVFFQPLNRLAASRVSQAAEYLCDDWAAHHTEQPLALASCLTEIATWVAHTGPVAATMAGPRSILGRRVHRLLQPPGSSRRPSWLVAGLALPLLAMVAVAPGVSVPAHAERDERPTVVIVDDATLEQRQAGDDDHVLVIRTDDGRSGLVFDVYEDEAPAEPLTRKEERARKRSADKARRKARKAVRRAFRDAKRRGDAVPSEHELRAIVERSAAEAGQPWPEQRRRGHRNDDELRVHLTVPGQVQVHGRLPVNVEDLQELEEVMEVLEHFEDLPIDLSTHEGKDGTEIRVIIDPDEHERHGARHAPRADADREAALALERALARRAQAERQHEARAQRRSREQVARELERAAREAERDLARWQQEQRRERTRNAKEQQREAARRQAERIRALQQQAREAQREAERIRRRVEREQRRAPASGQAPVVRRRRGASQVSSSDPVFVMVSPPAPPALPTRFTRSVPSVPAPPAPAFPGRVAPVAPVAPAVPMTTSASTVRLPAAPAAPAAPTTSSVVSTARVPAAVPAPVAR
ncbi:MAG: M56 family metallopeptidase [Planctomycetota bacterium]